MTLYKKWGRTTSSCPIHRTILLRQFSGDPLSPPLHTYINTAWQTKFREGIQINLLQALARRQDHITLVVVDGSGEHIKAGERASLHLSKDVAYFLSNRRIKICNAGLKFLTFHEAIQTQRACIGITIIPAWFIRPSDYAFGDSSIDRSPNPVGGGEAGIHFAGAVPVIGHAPFALFLRHIGNSGSIRAGEHNLRAPIEQGSRGFLLEHRERANGA